MGDLVNLNKEANYDVEYILDGDGSISGVTHPSWPFEIMRDQETKTETAFVCKTTGEPFGIINSDQFNTLLMCWLLVDSPEIVDGSANG